MHLQRYCVLQSQPRLGWRTYGESFEKEQPDTNLRGHAGILNSVKTLPSKFVRDFRDKRRGPLMKIRGMKATRAERHAAALDAYQQERRDVSHFMTVRTVFPGGDGGFKTPRLNQCTPLSKCVQFNKHVE
eukprot:2293549-Pyramimonas_sp.AAC.1